MESSPIGMSHPSRWLALLRIVIGLYFAKAIWTKMTVMLVGGFLPVPAVQDRWLQVMPGIVAKQASGNPILFYKQFLEQTVIPNAPVFARLAAWGSAGRPVGTAVAR